jgi:hypothetical protein
MFASTRQAQGHFGWIRMAMQPPRPFVMLPYRQAIAYHPHDDRMDFLPPWMPAPRPERFRPRNSIFEAQTPADAIQWIQWNGENLIRELGNAVGAIAVRDHFNQFERYKDAMMAIRRSRRDEIEDLFIAGVAEPWTDRRFYAMMMALIRGYYRIMSQRTGIPMPDI